jgi:hypothetical protein
LASFGSITGPFIYQEEAMALQERLHSIMDDAAATPGGVDKLRRMGNRWFDRAHRWNSEAAKQISDACAWRGLAICKRDYGQIDEALKFEDYADRAVAAIG